MERGHSVFSYLGGGLGVTPVTLAACSTRIASARALSFSTLSKCWNPTRVSPSPR